MTEIVGNPDESLTSETCKLPDFFAAYTDTAAVEASGVTPARGSAVRTAPRSTPTQRTRTLMCCVCINRASACLTAITICAATRRLSKHVQPMSDV